MSRLPRFLRVAVTCLTFLLTGSEAIFQTEALTTKILKPIRATGDDVGLIFIPGSYIKGEQYSKTAQAIQEASELRVWVALTGSYLLNRADPQQVHRAVEGAIRKLGQAGMTSKNYVGVGHESGGHYIQEYARSYPTLKAIVLMGSVLPRDIKLREFPTRVLTLSAELDGVTRITRIAEEYEKLTDDSLWNFLPGIYRTPVISMEGVNHAQFASGLMPPHVQAGDLPANVTEEQAHLMIGQHVNDFLTATFSTNDSHIDEALAHLTRAFFKSVQKFQPFVDMKNLDTDGEESMWTVLAQEYFAGEYGDSVGIYNEVLENPSFFARQPTIKHEKNGVNTVIVGTAALVHVEDKSDVLQFPMNKESPREINMKLVSKDAIWKALASKNDTSLRTAPNTCESLNRLALGLALTLSDDKAKERYGTRGRPIIFEEDVLYGSNLMWAATPVDMWEDDAGLHVKSVAMVTPITNFLNPGVHYCKVMSPYRAMEWVNVDSLRAYRKLFDSS